MEREARAGHLTDEELFGLALPPAGEPEALPSHLLACAQCGRNLQEWKTAVRQLAREDVEPVLRRTPEEWRAREDATLEALRRAGTRQRSRRLPWIAGIAASLLLAALLLTARRAPRASEALVSAATPSNWTDASELSAQDAADDALLRDVARLSRGEQGGSWNRLAPDPGASSDEEPL